MKIALVTGSRRWNQYIPIEMKLKGHDLLLHGGCPTGADALAEEVAKELQIDSLILRARWTQEGKSAGPRRNERLVFKASQLREQGHEVHCFAFPVGDSPGTRSCMRFLKAYRFEVDVTEGDIRDL